MIKHLDLCVKQQAQDLHKKTGAYGVSKYIMVFIAVLCCSCLIVFSLFLCVGGMYSFP